jgi:hypothetical protein
MYLCNPVTSVNCCILACDIFPARRFEVFTEVKMWILIMWVVTLCNTIPCHNPEDHNPYFRLSEDLTYTVAVIYHIFQSGIYSARRDEKYIYALK